MKRTLRGVENQLSDWLAPVIKGADELMESFTSVVRAKNPSSVKNLEDTLKMFSDEYSKTLMTVLRHIRESANDIEHSVIRISVEDLVTVTAPDMMSRGSSGSDGSVSGSEGWEQVEGDFEQEPGVIAMPIEDIEGTNPLKEALDALTILEVLWADGKFG